MHTEYGRNLKKKEKIKIKTGKNGVNVFKNHLN